VEGSFALHERFPENPDDQLGSEPDPGLTSEPSNSIVERAAEAVDVIRDSDRQRGLSKVTPSLRP
jgi:hypothetical protein